MSNVHELLDYIVMQNNKHNNHITELHDLNKNAHNDFNDIIDELRAENKRLEGYRKDFFKRGSKLDDIHDVIVNCVEYSDEQKIRKVKEILDE
jgi:predicted nuclease with TOPRIM domain